MHNRAIAATSSQPWTKFFFRCVFWSGSRRLREVSRTSKVTDFERIANVELQEDRYCHT